MSQDGVGMRRKRTNTSGKKRTKCYSKMALEFGAVDGIRKCLQVFDQNHGHIFGSHLVELEKVEIHACHFVSRKEPTEELDMAEKVIWVIIMWFGWN